MLAETATVADVLSREEGLQFIATLGWSMALGLTLLLWALLEKVDHENRSRKSATSEDATRERLFGRRVVESGEDEAEASEAGPSGDPQLDAGPPSEGEE